MIVYLNGKFIPQEKATVSVMDRGFLFGDGVYEMIASYRGHLFLLKQHLERLANSLTAIRLKLPFPIDNLTKVIKTLVEKNNRHGDLLVYVQITRGVMQERSHRFPSPSEPTVFICCKPLKHRTMKELGNGVNAITLPDNRWGSCQIKSTSLLPNLLLYQEAVDQNAEEAILIRDGYAVEGASSNLFILSKGSLITPEKNNAVLGGVTRQFLLHLADENELPYQEQAISEKELYDADEIWISSTSRTVLPVTQLNQKTIGDGRPGPWWTIIFNAFQKVITSGKYHDH